MSSVARLLGLSPAGQAFVVPGGPVAAEPLAVGAASPLVFESAAGPPEATLTSATCTGATVVALAALSVQRRRQSAGRRSICRPHQVALAASQGQALTERKEKAVEEDEVFEKEVSWEEKDAFGDICDAWLAEVLSGKGVTSFSDLQKKYGVKPELAVIAVTGRAIDLDKFDDVGRSAFPVTARVIIVKDKSPEPADLKRLVPRKDRSDNELAKIDRIQTALAIRSEDRIVKMEDDFDIDDDQVVPGVGLFVKRDPEILRRRAPVWTLADLPVIPFLGQPKYRQWCPNYPGDYGFDPLNLGFSEAQFKWNWDAEMKHARLAMLAVVGWPAAETFQPLVSEFFKQPDMLAEGGRSPSFLNGSLGEPINFLLVGMIFSLFTVGDWLKPTNTGPGDYRFDPLGLREVEIPFISRLVPPGQTFMDNAEMANGRLAMLALTFFVYEEYTFGLPVTEINIFELGLQPAPIPAWPFGGPLADGGKSLSFIFEGNNLGYLTQANDVLTDFPKASP